MAPVVSKIWLETVHRHVVSGNRQACVDPPTVYRLRGGTLFACVEFSTVVSSSRHVGVGRPSYRVFRPVSDYRPDTAGYALNGLGWPRIDASGVRLGRMPGEFRNAYNAISSRIREKAEIAKDFQLRRMGERLSPKKNGASARESTV